MPARIRRGDEVIVISGKDNGKSGKVLRVDPAKQRVYVEGLSMIKRHQRARQGSSEPGGVIEKEGPIHVSNVMLVDPDRNTRTRIGRRRDSEGNPERFAKKSGAALA